jgi:hypothetical protein
MLTGCYQTGMFLWKISNAYFHGYSAEYGRKFDEFATVSSVITKYLSTVRINIYLQNCSVVFFKNIINDLYGITLWY